MVGATSRGRVWLWTGLDGDDGVVARRIHDGVEGYGEMSILNRLAQEKGDEGMKRTAEVLVQPKGSTEVLRVDCPMDGRCRCTGLGGHIRYRSSWSDHQSLRGLHDSAFYLVNRPPWFPWTLPCAFTLQHYLSRRHSRSNNSTLYHSRR